jgi:cystathionine gamma-synthase
MSADREDRPLGFATRAVHGGAEPDAETGAVVPAIVTATTFAQDGVARPRAYEYARSGNPTRAALERALADLEAADHGFAFASGLAALDVLFRAVFAPDRSEGAARGGRLLVGDVYGGTWRLASRLPAGDAEVVPVDVTDPDTVASEWTDDTCLLLVESPTNPHLHIVDLDALGAVAQERGGLLAVDSTFATPVLTRPIEHGAHVVVHSTTKYIGGHSDVVGGFLATSDAQLAGRIGFVQYAAGAVPSPFDCYLSLRGIRTLALRIERHCANAATIAAHLAAHPAVERVLYPGLPDHPGHDIATRQMRLPDGTPAYGGMVGVVVRGGEAAARRLCESTRVFTLAESLGAVESLIEHPAAMTHASVAGSPLAIDPALVRLSVGIEDVADLLADLDAALSRG